MSDLSTPEEIRAEVVEVLAQAECAVEARPLVITAAEWERVPATVQDRYRRRAAVLADALAAAGMLVTGVEISSAFPDEPEADDETMRRYVTDWREPEVTE